MHAHSTRAHTAASPDSDHDLGLLRSLELFTGVPDGELEEIAARCSISTAHPG